jgi:hypothetical protein
VVYSTFFFASIGCLLGPLTAAVLALHLDQTARDDFWTIERRERIQTKKQTKKDANQKKSVVIIIN